MRHLLLGILMLVPAQAAQLRITVYDQAHLSRRVSEAVFDILRRILVQAGIDGEFAAGDLAAPVPASDEQKAKARKVALLASRTNFALSIPLVLWMGSATHGLPF